MGILDALPTYRVRQGDNLYIPGKFTKESAHTLAKFRASQELPLNEGGARFYVIRETIEECYP
jgi:hypothetical protein